MKTYVHKGTYTDRQWMLVDAEGQVLGRLACERAADVEFSAASQQWEVRRAGQDQVLFRSSSRCACLKWELEHLAPVQQ